MLLSCSEKKQRIKKLSRQLRIICDITYRFQSIEGRMTLFL